MLPSQCSTQHILGITEYASGHNTIMPLELFQVNNGKLSIMLELYRTSHNPEMKLVNHVELCETIHSPRNEASICGTFGEQFISLQG